jgi:hypothetical protein
VAPPGADIAEDQKGGGAGVPTFPAIRTAGLFADGVEIEPHHRLFDVQIVRTGFGFDFEPGWETRTADVI